MELLASTNISLKFGDNTQSTINLLLIQKWYLLMNMKKYRKMCWVKCRCHFLFFLNFLFIYYTLGLAGDFRLGVFYLLGLTGIEFNLPFDFLPVAPEGLLNWKRINLLDSIFFGVLHPKT